MASTTSNGAFQPRFILTPEQQDLLLTALNSNKPFSPSSYQDSPNQKSDFGSVQDSPFLDNYDYDYGADSSFDFDISNDQPKMIGDLPGDPRSESMESDTAEKRTHPDDEDEEDDTAEKDGGNSAKRRESNEKIPKKPGRKPLTSEPTTKRKAQNRAAQRAFRERKEKHLKDLETKVEDLEKASAAANNENATLKTQLESITAELNEYKKKVQLMSNARSYTHEKPSLAFNYPAINGLNDLNFQFDFPKFGVLPGPPPSSKPSSQSPPSLTSPPLSDSNPVSPDHQRDMTASAGVNLTDPAVHFPGLFTPPLSNNAMTNASRGSLDSLNFGYGAGATSSPSASSNSNMGPSSSCGTSPEPFTQSPMGFKPVDTMSTIGEEQGPLTVGGQSIDQFDGIGASGGVDWLAQQNGGQFDPQLFGDYREPQDSILSNVAFDDNLFGDLDADFLTPFNMPPTPAIQQKNLIAEIDEKQVTDDSQMVPAGIDDLTCNKIWDKLQDCPKIKNGDIDLDGLCSELQKKAKCSGKGPTVKEQDFKETLRKYLGKDFTGDCNSITTTR